MKKWIKSCVTFIAIFYLICGLAAWTPNPSLWAEDLLTVFVSGSAGALVVSVILFILEEEK